MEAQAPLPSLKPEDKHPVVISVASWVFVEQALIPANLSQVYPTSSILFACRSYQGRICSAYETS